MSSLDFFAASEALDVRDIQQKFDDKRINISAFLLLMHAYACQTGDPAGFWRDRENGKSKAGSPYRQHAHIRGGEKSGSKYEKLLRGPGGSLELMRELGLIGLVPNVLDRLPRGSVALQFDFKLEKNYVSRDDAVFYPIDNPVRKDRVFKAPFVSGATWKGSLRAAAVEGLLLRCERGEGDAVKERLDLIAIFGDEKAGGDEAERDNKDQLAGFLDGFFRDKGLLHRFEEERGKRFPAVGDELHKMGRIRVLPSFFDAIDVDVINPRNRETRAGTLPIEIEMVPAGAKATFAMTYVPFDLLHLDGSKLTARARSDWKLLGEALVRMLRELGFGAKKTSGCGRVCNKMESVPRFECKDVPGFRARTMETIESLEHLGACFEVSA